MHTTFKIRGTGLTALSAGQTTLLLLMLLMTSCRPRPPLRTTVSESWMTMGTMAALTLPTGDADRLAESAEAVRQSFDGVDRRYSVYRQDSVLSRLANRAGLEAVKLDAGNAALIRDALMYAESTGGAFDPTVGPLLSLWGFGASAVETPPAEEAIAAVRARVGWRLVDWIPDSDPANVSIKLTRPGMQLDLGGIAKGYALDLAYEALIAAGLSDFMIELGGELRCQGRPTPEQPGWRIGVRHPFEAERVIGSLLLTDGQAVATSGHYERFREIDGQRYAHIIDPRDGKPVSGMAGVTVLAPSALASDALSTALFVMGIQTGVDWLGKRPGIDALFVPDRQPMEIHLTPGMADRFTPLPSYAEAVRVVGSGRPDNPARRRDGAELE